MKIELGKEYRLANGMKFRLYAVNAGGNHPVHGAYLDDDKEWKHQCWMADGKLDKDEVAQFNLIEVRPRHKVTVWINFYTGNLWFNLSRADADTSAASTRLACVEYTFDFAEGDGL